MPRCVYVNWVVCVKIYRSTHLDACVSCALRACVYAGLCVSTCLAVCCRQCSVCMPWLADSVWVLVGVTAGGSTFLSLEAAWPLKGSPAAAPCFLQLEMKARGRGGSPLCRF